MGRWTVALIGFCAVASVMYWVPRLLRPTCEGMNSVYAITRLRSLHSAQENCWRLAPIDVDRDGTGEYGTFAELSGAVGVRLDPAGEARGAPMAPTLLPSWFTVVDSDGVVAMTGYLFRVFLPAQPADAAREGGTREWLGAGRGRGVEPMPPAGSPMVGRVDTDRAEARWCAYAWPVAVPTSGRETFFVDVSGIVFETANADGRYAGSGGGPAWDAALPAAGPAGWVSLPAKGEHRGRDGNLWRRRN